MTDTATLTAVLKARAEAHINQWVPGPARFVDVTDRDVADLLLILEAGTVIYRSPNGNWFAPGARMAHRLSRTVAEAVRTGLVTHLRHQAGPSVTHHLVPAFVHLARTNDWRSRCGVPGEGMGPKRVRLVRDAALVDCLGCVDPL